MLLFQKNMKPLRTNILIEPYEHKSEVFALSEKLTIEKASVLEIGSQVVDIKQHDTVYYKNYAPDVIEIEGKEYVFIKEEDVIALS